VWAAAIEEVGFYPSIGQEAGRGRKTVCPLTDAIQGYFRMYPGPESTLRRHAAGVSFITVLNARQKSLAQE